MNLFILDTIGERIRDASVDSLIGMATIFIVLSVIWGILEISGRIFGKEKKAAENVTEVPEPAAEEDRSPEIAAAITAAITLLLEEEAARKGQQSAPGFRVVSFRRAGGTRPWNQTRKGR